MAIIFLLFNRRFGPVEFIGTNDEPLHKLNHEMVGACKEYPNKRLRQSYAVDARNVLAPVKL